MSASTKKKLRAAERAEKLTEKQLTEQKEAKKLKLQTTVFVVILAVMVCFAAVIGVTKTIEGKGIREKNTVAVTIGEHELSNAELNFYYIDAVNNFYSNYGTYASMFGLDVTLPLDKQITDVESGRTWADDFIDSAVENAKTIYALNDAAAAAGYTLSEEEQAEVDAVVENNEFYALYYYGYSDLDSYLKAMYGKGANEEGLRKYIEMQMLAQSYQNHHASTLTYADADLRAAEAENYDAYSQFSYNTYYLNTNEFVNAPEGVAATDYTAEQLAQGAADAEAAAKELTAEGINTVEALNAAIAALPVNAEKTGAASTACNGYAYGDISALYADWIADDARKAGDVAYFANVSTGEDAKINGYYVVMFNEANDNNFPLVNVRHILKSFKGGTQDPNTGVVTYSDEEKATAKAEAEALLALWEAGDKTEDSFGILANENSDDGNGTTGGLFTDVYPGLMLTNINDWCFDASRKVGDTGIVESTSGYHIMYFVGNSDVIYRDYLIENDLRDADMNSWYEALVADITTQLGDTKYLSTDLVLTPAA